VDASQNHGLFTERYESDAVPFGEAEIVLHTDHQRFKTEHVQVPIALTTNEIVDFSRAHIEVLHVMHNGIQTRCFGHSELYDYRRETKKLNGTRFSGLHECVALFDLQCGAMHPGQKGTILMRF
jgi:hypothetical protein